jgi:3',5'-cyclic AMP phosphodiesterase CpdA
VERRHLTIAQISDIHCGHPMFDEGLLEHTVDEVADLAPDLVVVAGDLTAEGYAPQFRQAKRYLDRLEGLEMIVVPGNHDLRNARPVRNGGRRELLETRPRGR